MDNELFELCKEVYRRFPEWSDTAIKYSEDEYKPNSLVIETVYEKHVGFYDNAVGCDECEGEHNLTKLTPLYTSDYLLEKLPYKIGKGNSAIWLRLGKTRNGFTVCFMGSDLVWLYECEDDTPLKALLKLTLALHEAGELQPASNGRELQ